MSSGLIDQLDNIHTTELGAERIEKNVGIDAGNAVTWCIQKIRESESITREGKNWYVRGNGFVITINAQSYTIITAHKENTNKKKCSLSHANSPRAVLIRWVEAFNRADADTLAAMYAEDAVNHQVANDPVVGRSAIHKMFKAEFAAAEMVCIIENMFENNEWAIMEWRDPLGLRGCGFFHIVNGKIVFQRGYWDKLSFLRQHNFPTVP